MAGDTDLDRMLASLDVERRPSRYTFVTGDWPALAGAADAVVREAEGPTYVVPVDHARAAGAPIEFDAVWLTLKVHSSLAAVGLTAVVSQALAEAAIPCNVLAGYHHDHLLVPNERADDAIAIVRGLSSR